jgi:1-acyl-sn-glycerol-3-phosphate acyltransferase
VRDAVAALREEIDARFGRGRGAERDEPDARGPAPGAASPDPAGLLGWLSRAIRDAVEDVDVMELFDEIRARLPGGGSDERIPQVDQFGADALYLARVRPLLDFVYERWWRVRVAGAERIPESGPVLYVANRSGVLPYDALMIAHAVEREGPARERPRFLVADWLLGMPFFQPALTRLGGVRACPENVERLIAAGHSVIAFPEGQKGALKPFRDRYRLQRFGRGGFVSLAVQLRAAIVPVAVIGAEEAHPVLLRSGLAERLLGLPLPVTPTFPHLGPLGAVPLPSQWRLRFGEPVGFHDVPPGRADDPLYVNRMREQVRGTIQGLVDEELTRRSTVWS